MGVCVHAGVCVCMCHMYTLDEARSGIELDNHQVQCMLCVLLMYTRTHTHTHTHTTQGAAITTTASSFRRYHPHNPPANLHNGCRLRSAKILAPSKTFWCVCVCVCVCVCICACAYACTHTHTHTHDAHKTHAQQTDRDNKTNTKHTQNKHKYTRQKKRRPLSRALLQGLGAGGYGYV